MTFEYGSTTGYGNTVTAAPNPVTGTSNTPVSAGITGLIPGSVYHYRLKAVNCGGTKYGDDQIINTGCTEPAATTNAATNIGSTTATLNGTVDANNFSTTVTFEYGLTTGYGSTITASQSPVAGTSNTAVGAGITRLIPNSVYHFRVKAVNCGGTINGTDRTFNTLCLAPTATTGAYSVSSNDVVISGTVNANNSSTTVIFDYGTTSSYGSTIAASPSPIAGTSNTSVNAMLTGLIPNTRYYYRVRASNCGGTTNAGGNYFTTLPLTDLDGNTYNVVIIGTQVWMASNLKTTKYNDGGNIPNITSTWSSQTSGAYCWYNNNVTNKAAYGALYNWYAVNTGKLCPTNWHVPSDTEWLSLMSYLGGTAVAGGKLKEMGTGHWITPNTGASNDYGFTALPGGHRSGDGNFFSISTAGDWWASGTWWQDVNYGTGFFMYNTSAGVSYGATGKKNGNSVRCIKN